MAENKITAPHQSPPPNYRPTSASRDCSAPANAPAPVAGLDGKDKVEVEQEELSQERIRRIVELNCFGEDYSDPAASACRGEVPCSFVGLWPEFALLNHSCMPNSCMMVLQGTMFVRTAVPLRRGTEVTINYAGDLVASPLAVRQGHLRDTFGFSCRCLRCVRSSTCAPFPVLMGGSLSADGGG